MGVNDAQEMLEAAQAECIRLEKELATRTKQRDELFELTDKHIDERDVARAELAELASSSGSDHIAAKYWKQRQDARNELCTVKDQRDALKWERDTALAVIEQVRAIGIGDAAAELEIDRILTQSPASALAKVKADTLREAADASPEHIKYAAGWLVWLRAEADRIEKEADRG